MTPEMKAVGGSLQVCLSVSMVCSLLGEVDPVLKSCHGLQQLSIVEVHVVGKVCANRRLHAPQCAVECSSSHTEENGGYAQQDEQDAGASANLICGQQNRGYTSSSPSPISSPAALSTAVLPGLLIYASCVLYVSLHNHEQSVLCVWGPLLRTMHSDELPTEICTLFLTQSPKQHHITITDYLNSWDIRDLVINFNC